MGARLTQKNEEYLLSGAKYEIYSDFDHNFIPHPNTAQITRKTNIDSVKMSLRNLLLTNKYERIRNPDFGGNIRRYLFEPFIETTAIEIEDEIRRTVSNYEPRVQILNVDVSANEDIHTLNINITFGIVTSDLIDNLELTLYRVR